MTMIIQPQSYRIQPARSPADMAAAAALFREYAASLDVDLAYQAFEAELAALPGKYAAPHGELLLARDQTSQPIGCVAMRAIDVRQNQHIARQANCEMKRLYVLPQARGSGLGRDLIKAILTAAKAAGYHAIWLDTLPMMHSAQALYRKLGFETVQAYYNCPIAGTVFMRHVLR